MPDPGDFSASRVADIVLRQEEMFGDSRVNRELKKPLTSAKAVFENQMVSWVPVMVGNKCVGVKATSLRGCDDAVEDMRAVDADPYTCDIDGTQLHSTSDTFEDNIEIRKSFSVYDDECKDEYDFNDKYARAMLLTKLALEKELNKRVISHLDGNTMQNRFSSGYGTVSATKTTYQKSEWTVNLLGQFDLAVEFNEINNPILLNGTNFYEDLYLAQFNSANDNQRDQMLKFNDWDNWYFDPRNVDAVIGAPVTFMFDAGSVGFFCKNEFTNEQPQSKNDSKNTMTWVEESMNLSYRDGNSMTPVKFDVYQQRTCNVVNPAEAGKSSKRRWATHTELVLTAGLHTLPADCDGGTGILKFEQVADV